MLQLESRPCADRFVACNRGSSDGLKSVRRDDEFVVNIGHIQAFLSSKVRYDP